ncbi:putative flavoprotein [Rubellimicrobium thermophilum DSM 16684]|uniref:Putative flavoprotein n=1 Tax=Rubellimicrobium thermophilum DSM 16684 TaxID=1123069 RepID=S9R5J3_9RHOB|nr:NAD(P)H-dependent oxidoreductase [Rubellimicrobium thermophilum]EPX87167.1 putative flavoprotein [Rubellimicrobium thermophilum DSM 16684]
MADKPRIALVISSVRKTRWADKPAQWLLKKMQARTDIEAEIVDLRDFDLPIFDEPASNAYVPTSNPVARRWQETIAKFDGYVFLLAEYNRSITGALKNALDHDYTGWNNKPMGLMAYGSAGGARAAEHMRLIAIELQMVPVRAGVHVGGSDFYRVGPYNPNPEPMEALEDALAGSVKDMLDQVAWYARVLKAARAEKAAAAA